MQSEDWTATTPPPDCVGGIRRRTASVSVSAFRDWFGLGEGYARLLLVLYAHAGNPLSWRELAAKANSHQPMSRGALHEAIRMLRRCMDAEAIDRDDTGYWLTAVGLAECRRAFRELAQQLMTMGAEPANDITSLRTPEQASD